MIEGARGGGSAEGDADRSAIEGEMRCVRVERPIVVRCGRRHAPCVLRLLCECADDSDTVSVVLSVRSVLPGMYGIRIGTR